MLKFCNTKLLKWLVKSSRHSDAPPLCAALQQLLHAQHVSSTHSSECVSAWLLMHTTDVCVAEFSTCHHWATHTLTTATPSIFFVSLFLWFMSVLLTGFHCKSNIKMFHWILCYLKPDFPFSPHLPQKRAKKLEGETIYIRHSNLMLEVCIFAVSVSVLAVCRHVFSACMDVVLMLLLWHLS